MRIALRRIPHLYRVHFADPRRELLFLSGSSFFVAFVMTRGVTRLIFHDIGPLRSVKYKGLHIHHQVWGILMLIGSGHAWLHLASRKRRDDRWLLRATTVVYGVGSALTLDELALWLNMEDVYWQSPGREIIDAGIIVTSLASIGAWGAPFFAAVAREARAGAPAASAIDEPALGPPTARAAEDVASLDQRSEGVGDGAGALRHPSSPAGSSS